MIYSYLFFSFEMICIEFPHCMGADVLFKLKAKLTRLCATDNFFRSNEKVAVLGYGQHY